MIQVVYPKSIKYFQNGWFILQSLRVFQVDISRHQTKDRDGWTEFRGA